ncbi:uncharacterized protein SETTUDRAFT_181508 [Exserohilum turcica Et28A]|uniref:Annexin n=1 Tax=Exserohilum turcicum (strain 28A) TaxID=671987 RepID=R0JYC4_EXST2|nr:uncharacterized protein SETTUDRAFT_181508 [Exserohilum turcica Et28A]EOA81227.1 hypothetical protein SETTUDRAFT_181508 [Exserohilum turcica Et28A]
MSLRPDSGSRRSRSKSPGHGRERDHSRSRSHSHVREPQRYGPADGAPTPQFEIRQPDQQYATPQSQPITMGNYGDLPPHQRPAYAAPAPGGVQYAQPGTVQYAPTGNSFSYTSAPASSPHAKDGAFQYATPPSNITYTAKPVANPNQPPLVRHTSQPSYPPPAQPQYTAVPNVASPTAPYPTMSQAPQSQPKYTTMPQAPQAPPALERSFPPPPIGRHSPLPDHRRAASYSGAMSTNDGLNVVEVRPQGHLGATERPEGLRIDGLSVSGNRPDLQTIVPSGYSNGPDRPDGYRPDRLSVSGNRPDLQTIVPGGYSSGPERSDGFRPDRLSVSGNRPDLQTIVPGGMPGGYSNGLPPPSPLLEAYHGTYQSISPMPQALMLDDQHLDHLQPLDALERRSSNRSKHGHRRAHSSSRRSPSQSRPSKNADKLALAAYGRNDRSPEKKEKRRVRIYDATDDALALVEAMAQRTPNADTIIDIIPALSHDQLLELRAEYKRHCKVQGRGINIAKHIKLKTSGSFGKIAYVTALGKYESEGYWANYWYQSNSARRELLIEALMGRQNHEIREIKDTFKDKRYGDSLTRCMDKELKADKFRKAVLMALDAQRQEESDVWPPEYCNRDVDTLYRAINAREGGESTMLSIVVMRSDAHLREVLRTYERKYHANFARDALKKSNNLVGEVIAHILNGVINRPARDAMLLHHALMDLIEPPTDARSSSSSSAKHDRQQRVELLISRLVRLHWDRLHLMRAMAEYEEKYGRMVEEDIEEATKGDFRQFCIAICQSAR